LQFLEKCAIIVIQIIKNKKKEEYIYTNFKRKEVIGWELLKKR